MPIRHLPSHRGSEDGYSDDRRSYRPGCGRLRASLRLVKMNSDELRCTVNILLLPKSLLAPFCRLVGWHHQVYSRVGADIVMES
jgi:hypothetical protein